MNIFHALILGLIEGLTEFLPISSTAHLVLAGEWLRLPSSDFLKTFEISIQLGAILAVVVLYWKRIWSSWQLVGRIIAAFLPTAVIGLAFYKTVKDYLLDNTYIIAAALFLGGIVIIWFERSYSRRLSGKVTTVAAALADNQAVLPPQTISYQQAVVIGLCQSLAIIPGTSRAAATIIGGLGLGIKRQEIVEFSFLLAIPTMLAATGLDLIKSRAALAALSGYDLSVWLIGFVMAFITAIIGVRFFLRYIQKNDFVAFGWYRIVFGLAILVWLFLA
ncbi:MAG: undecaprenyl-diphosphate phosphatase [Patescibacteria group bacterium]